MQKRWLLSGLGACALLGGSTLYTIGHVTEQQFQAGLPLETQDYQRGILSAEAHQQMFLPPNPFELPRQLTLQHHIQHSLLLTPTRIDTRFVARENQTADKLWLHATTTVQHDGSASGVFDLPTYQQSQGLSWHAAQGQWQLQNGHANINAALPGIQWDIAHQRWQLEQVKLQGQGQIPHNSEGSLHFKGFSESVGGIEALSFQHGSLTWRSEYQQAFVDVSITLRIEQLRIADHAYQNAEFNAQLKRIDVPAWLDLLDALQASLNTDPSMRLLAILSLLKPLQAVLQDLPEITVDKLILRDESAVSVLDSSMAVSASNTAMPLTVLNIAQFIDASAQATLAKPLLESAAAWLSLNQAQANSMDADDLLQHWLALLQRYARQDEEGRYRIGFRLQQGQWELNPAN